MKVLYITTMYPVPEYPQQGIFCHEQVKALMDAGVDVTVAVPVAFYNRPRVKTWDHEGVHIRYIRYFKVPGTWMYEMIGHFLYVSLLHSDIDMTQFDVIHADSPLPSGYAAMLLSQKFGIPFVIHCHGLDVFLDKDYGECANYPMIRKIVEKVYLTADAIVGVSQKTIDNVNTRLAVAQKSYVVYNGVDCDSFSPENRSERGNILKIVSIGNLIDLKGHDLSIQAIGRLVREGNTDISLDIFGRGNKETELKELVKSLEIEKYVTFCGYVPYDEIANKLRKYDVFLLPSWYEAIGCVYLEAMASGLITIGCFENGIDEVIIDNVNGFLVRPHNVEDIVNLLKRLSIEISNESVREIAQKGRTTVVTDFSWQKSAETLLCIYKKIG